MSDNPKSRGEEAVVSTEKQPVDMKRLLNVGKEVELSFGKFTVKELSVFDLLATMSDGLEAFVSVIEVEVSSELELIQIIVSDKRIQDQFCKLLALCCQSTDFDLFKTMTTTDLLKIIKTAKEVIDFEEIKETFFELGLQKYLKNQTPISTEK